MPYEVLDAATPRYEVLGGVSDAINNDEISQGARNFAGEGWGAKYLNTLAGAVRGAGSFGATIAAPYDYAMDALKGDRGKNLSSLVTGQELPSRNAERRAQIDQNMQELLGADPNSLLYKIGKIGGEIAGTAGVGGVLANGARALTPLATSLPQLNTLGAIARGLETGGFRVGSMAGTPAGMAVRAGTGAAVGGASAGLVNPQEAGLGAGIGGVLPLGAQLAGKIGGAAGSIFGRNPQPNARTLDTARQSMDAGYIIPPSTINPTFGNRMLESISGKQATQQLASTNNTNVTEGLVRKALGLPEDAQLTQATMENLRKTAGKAYAEVADLSPQAASDLEALKAARNESQGWFKAYNRSANPNDLAQAKAARDTAANLENWLEYHAASAGQPELISALRDARTQIAKTYTVGRALNDAAGTVDARMLGRMYEKGMPLSDGLDTAGQFASAFPTAAKSPQQIGSPDTHNLKSVLAMALGLGGHAAAGPGGLLTAALPFVAPPLARSIMFSQRAQRDLLNAGLPMLDEAAPMGLLTQGAYRGSPVLIGQ